jgi:hypothetical protein
MLFAKSVLDGVLHCDGGCEAVSLKAPLHSQEDDNQALMWGLSSSECVHRKGRLSTKKDGFLTSPKVTQGFMLV